MSTKSLNSLVLSVNMFILAGDNIIFEMVV